MRRLLLTLINIVSKCPIEDDSAFLIQFTIFSCIQFMGDGVEPPPTKPALQALEHLLTKRVINPAQLILMLRRKNLGLYALNRKVAYSDELSKTSRTEWLSSVDELVSSVLEWVQYPDIASAAGRFLSSFFRSIQIDPVDFEYEDREEYEQVLPLWLPPIKKALHERPEILDALEKHILPGLLRLNPTDTKAFLETLPIKDLQEGFVGIHTLINIRLCLLTVRTVVELGMSHLSRII